MSSGAGPVPSNFPYGFANGVVVRGVPLLQSQPGNVYWLDNGPVSGSALGGSDSNKGTFQQPFASLDYAMSACTPGNGDVIFVKPGHAETISSSTDLSLDCSDVAVVGLGGGTMRPKFTFDTSTGSTVNVTGENISLQNLQLVANFANITALFTFADASVTASLAGGVMTVTAVGSGTLYPGNHLNATGINQGTVILSQLTGTTGGVGTYAISGSQTLASGTVTTTTKGFAVDSCSMKDTSSILNFLSLFKTSTTDNAANGLSITRNFAELLATSGVVNLLAVNGSMDELSIVGNTYLAATTNAGAAIPFASGKTVKGLQLLSNKMIMVNAAATATGVIITSDTAGSTGIIDDNSFFSLANTTLANSLLVTAGTGIRFGTNRYARSADKSMVTSLPALDT